MSMRTNRFCFGSAAVATCLSVAIQIAQVASAASASMHGDCAQLISLKLPDVRITEAVAVQAGAGGLKVVHCRVAGVIAKEIHFSLLLPDEWNR